MPASPFVIEHMRCTYAWQDFVRERIERLERDYAKIPAGQRLGRDAEAIRFRIKVLKEANWASRSVRWTRFFFDCEYFHTLSDKMEVKLDRITPSFRVRKPSGDPAKDSNSKWLVQYHFGFYDTDALAAYVYGLLRIPVETK